MSHNPNDDPTLKPEAVAQRLGITITSVYSAIDHRELAAHRLGQGKGVLRVSENQCRAYLSKKWVKEFESWKDQKLKTGLALPEEKALFAFLDNAVSFYVSSHKIIRAEAAWYNSLEINGIQKRFAANVERLIPGARLVEARYLDLKHRPDFFVEVKNKLRVVEVKRDVIDREALRQIQRYMNVYKSDIGYVVAPRCTIYLPENVHFIICE